MLKIAEENLDTKIQLDQEERERLAQSKPIKVCITNASSPVCYNLINSIASGEVFGQDIEISLSLFDSEDKLEAIEGTKMEAFDLCQPLLRRIEVHTVVSEAFTNASCVIFLDEIEQDPEGTKEDWIKKNFELFDSYGRELNEVADKWAKVIVAGNGPINFNTSTLIKNCSNLQKWNIVSCSRKVENNVKSVLAKRLNVNSAYIVNAIIWGNSSGERYVDINNCNVYNYDGAIWGPDFYSVLSKEQIYEKKWLEKEFLEEVDQHTATIQAAMNREPAVSQAVAISSLLTHWNLGCSTGHMYSVGVSSEGWYQVPEGLVFSLPVRFNTPGYWSVVENIDLSEENCEKIKKCWMDLQSEWDIIYPPEIPSEDNPETDAETKDSAEGEKTGQTDSDEITEDKIPENPEGELKAEAEETVPENGKENSEDNEENEEKGEEVEEKEDENAEETEEKVEENAE